MDIVEAVQDASVPVLLMCLAQITGEPRWLRDPFLPTRDTSLFADASGGLSAAAQAEVRDHAALLVEELLTCARVVPEVPADADFHEMMRVYLGEPIPAEYVPMALEEMGLRDRRITWTAKPSAARLDEFRVLIIGAGVSGIGVAHALDELGINCTIVDKNDEVGGTWLENDYPGAGVDTPNHFYSYSFEPNLDWTRHYSKRDEVLGYLGTVAAVHGLGTRIGFGVQVTVLTWDDVERTWTVESEDARGPRPIEHYNAVITAVGQLNRPKTASLPGIESFPGEIWHSAEWRHDVPLAGLCVGIVGTGASAMQFMPTVADQAAHVTVFQRSPQWVRYLPDYDASIRPGEKWLFDRLPFYYQWYRFGLLWRYGDGLLSSLRRDPQWPHPERSMNRRNDRHREELTAYVLEQLAGRDDLIAKCLPDYPPYGKRILVDNGWYATLQRANVELVAEGVERIDGSDIVTDGGERKSVDVVVLATGFEAGRLLAPMHIVGRSGTPLRDVWGDENPSAYLGITIPDFPNLFCMYGPNTNVAHGGSVIFMAECQARHITLCLRDLLEARAGAIEVRRDVFDEYCRRVDEEHAQLVWTHPGMRNWYRNAQGRVFSPTPFRLVDYWQMTHDLAPDTYAMSGFESATRSPRQR